MEINKELLAKMRDHILEEPRRYDQTDWGTEVSTGVSPCGTQACLAGWAGILSGRCTIQDITHGRVSVWDIAAQELNLNSVRADRLFDWSWPAPFHKQYFAATTNDERAKVAAALLDKVIETDGAVLDSVEPA